jgi:hypothetical protein
MDDVKYGAEWPHRYSRNQGLMLKPGANELEVTLASIKVGSPGARGLDVTQMRDIALFINTTADPVTLCLDDVRLVTRKKSDGKPLLLNDFEGGKQPIWNAQGDVVVRAEKRPDGEKGNALRIEAGMNAPWPGIAFRGEYDFLDYDLFCVDVFCPEKEKTPEALGISFKDAQGVELKIVTGLKKGLNRLRVPLELAGMCALGKLTEVSVFSLYVEQGQVFHLDNIRLEQETRLVEGGVVNVESADGDPLRISFDALDQITAPVSAIAWAPLASGKIRVIRCTPPGGGPRRYSLNAGHLAGRDAKQPIRVWGYYRARLDHHWTYAEITLDEGKTAEVTFDDPRAFAQ